MRLFAGLVAVCVLSSPAIAQTPNCKTPPDVDGLQACYDRPVPADKPTATKPAAPVSARASAAKRDTKADPDKYVDPISAEEARLNAQMKTICRGC